MDHQTIIPFADYWIACRLYIEAGNNTPFFMSPFGFMAGWFAFKPMNGEPPSAWRLIYWILGFVPLVIVFIDRSDVLSAIMKAMLFMGVVAHFAWDVVYRGAR